MRRSTAVCALLIAACSSDSPAQRGRRAGGALAISTAVSIINRDTIETPHRCARFELAKRDGSLSWGERTLTWQGYAGRVQSAPDSLTIGALGDARTPRSLEVARAASELFAESEVDVVLSLGGISDSREEIEALLGTLCSPKWLVVALPGDREDLEAHRAAVAGQREAGCAIADGSSLRTLQWGQIMLATLPGASNASELIADTRGCLHTPGDASDITRTLGAHEGYRILASYVAPRQTGTVGSDLVDGVHMGSRALAEALARAEPNLVVHAQADRGAYETRGTERRRKDSSIFLATGALEPLPEPAGPATGYALTLRIRPSKTSWQRHPLRPAR